jgi:hypothetical protein
MKPYSQINQWFVISKRVIQSGPIRAGVTPHVQVRKTGRLFKLFCYGGSQIPIGLRWPLPVVEPQKISTEKFTSNSSSLVPKWRKPLSLRTSKQTFHQCIIRRVPSHTHVARFRPISQKPPDSLKSQPCVISDIRSVRLPARDARRF